MKKERKINKNVKSDIDGNWVSFYTHNFHCTLDQLTHA